MTENVSTRPCQCDDGTFDHDWYYDGGDSDVGLASAWVCKTCGEEDCNREPPSDDDDY